jgi:hypothetical protein
MNMDGAMIVVMVAMMGGTTWGVVGVMRLSAGHNLSGH